MVNPADIERAKQGRNVWNAWAEAAIEAAKSLHGVPADVDFINADISFSFEGFIFPGGASFVGAKFSWSKDTFKEAVFGHYVSFGRAEFDGSVSFERARFQTSTFRRSIFKDDVTFEGAKFAGDDCQFDYAEFCGDANFEEARFESSKIRFQHAQFKRAARFRKACFHNPLDFSQAEFQRVADFAQVTMKGGADFSWAIFDGVAAFEDCIADRPPDFRTARFRVAPNLHASQIGYEPGNESFCRRLFRAAADQHDVRRYRFLKKLAGDAKDHESEVAFLALELRAKRFHESKGFAAIALNLGYEWLSDFGRSVARPTVWLFAVTLSAATMIACAHWTGLDDMLSNLSAIVTLAITNAALLVGSDKWTIRLDAWEQLCASSPHCKPKLLLGNLLGYVQSAFSLFLLFLIGLGLRNRFRAGGSSN